MEQNNTCEECLAYQSNLYASKIRLRDRTSEIIQNLKKQESKKIQEEWNEHLEADEKNHHYEIGKNIIYRIQCLAENDKKKCPKISYNEYYRQVLEQQENFRNQNDFIIEELNEKISINDGSLKHRMKYLKNIELNYFPTLNVNNINDEYKTNEFLKKREKNEEKMDIEMKDCTTDNEMKSRNERDETRLIWTRSLIDQMNEIGVHIIDECWIPKKYDAVLFNWTRHEWEFQLFIFDYCDIENDKLCYGVFADQCSTQMYSLGNNQHRVNLNKKFFIETDEYDNTNVDIANNIWKKLSWKNLHYNAIEFHEINDFGIYGVIFKLNVDAMKERIDGSKEFTLSNEILEILKQTIPMTEHERLGF